VRIPGHRFPLEGFFYVSSLFLVPSAAFGPSPSIDGPRIGPDVPAFFVDIDNEDTRIVKQSFGTISYLGGLLTEDMDTS